MRDSKRDRASALGRRLHFPLPVAISNSTRPIVRRRASLASLAWSVVCACTSINANEYLVDSLSDAVDVLPGDGQCLSSAGTCTLRAAIVEANAQGQGTIRLGAGDYLLTLPGIDEDNGAHGDLDISADIHLLGHGAQATTISAQQLDRVIDVHAGEVTISDLTLTAGRVSGTGLTGSGGGIRIAAQAQLRLAAMALTTNSARSGAGAYVAGRLFGSDIALRQNGALTANSEGGGLAAAGTAVVILQRCQFRNNLARNGGGLILSGTSITLTMERCVLIGNSAHSGGAMYAETGANRIQWNNVTASANQAQGSGGAIFADGQSRLELIHSTLAFNNAGHQGGAIFDVRTQGTPAFVPTSLAAVIIANNQQVLGGQCAFPGSPGPIVSLGGNVFPSTGCAGLLNPTDVLTTKSGLLPLTSDALAVHPLSSGSAALDVAACRVHIDVRARRRPQLIIAEHQDACDAGAYERDAPGLVEESGFE